jgi:Flp pilus assembly protein TadD
LLFLASQRAEIAAQRAIQLDPTNADGHTALATHLKQARFLNETSP